MSFKREGNDTGLLSSLRKRRIQDLLGENIPEDEAKLLANGRFTCLVCPQHPIFDTVDILSIHRRGNKHKAKAEIHERKKEELRQLIAKRKHDKFTKSGFTSIQIAQSNYSGISNSSPYDSRVKRNKTKPGDRKLQLNLDSLPQQSQFSNSDSNIQLSSTQWQNLCEKQIEGPVKHESHLKKIFSKKTDEVIRLQPYTSKHRVSKKYEQCSSGVKLKCGSDQKSFNFSVKSCTKEVSQKERVNTKNSSGCTPISISCSKESTLTNVLSSLPPPQSSTKSSHKSKMCALGIQEPLSPQADIASKYWQLQGSGWKKDWDGKWIKDEQAEFNSDEEPPNLP